MVAKGEYRGRLRLFCLSGAVMFWLFHALNKEYTTEIDCPVHLAIDETKIEFIESPPRTIPLEVTGGGWKLLRYWLYFRAQPIELPIAKISKRGLVGKEQLRNALDKRLKGLKVNKVSTDTLYLRTRPKTTPRKEG